MGTKILALIITLAVGIPAFALSRVIWVDAPGSVPPTDAQLPFFIVLSLVESLLFGLGIAFIAFGLPLVRRYASRSRVGGTGWAMYAAIAWNLVSWWPHDNFHRAVGSDVQGLLYLEYGFHLTLIVTAIVIAKFFLDVTRMPRTEVA